MQLVENTRSNSFLIAEISAIRKNRTRLRTPEKRKGFASHSLALTEEGPLGTSHCFNRYQYSNRQSYEKLEVGLTPLLSIKVLFLIGTKTHFVQGKNAQT
jgi:hypothetical protein